MVKGRPIFCTIFKFVGPYFGNFLTTYFHIHLTKVHQNDHVAISYFYNRRFSDKKFNPVSYQVIKQSISVFPVRGCISQSHTYTLDLKLVIQMCKWVSNEISLAKRIRTKSNYSFLRNRRNLLICFLFLI
jgi:hypothetical protein